MLNKFFLGFLGFLTLPSGLAYCQATEAPVQDVPTSESKTLQATQNVQRESLGGVVGMSISPDGRFLYAAAYTKAIIHSFEIDQQNGQLKHLEETTAKGKLDGVVDVKLSVDGKLLVASSFASRTVTLFTRDTSSGKLTLADSINSDKSAGKGFQWPIRATFSKDGKFVYVADSGRSRSILELTLPAVIVLKVESDRLAFVESFRPKQTLGNARGLDMHPNGKSLFVTASDGQSLSHMSIDEASGKLAIIKVLRSNQVDNNVLDGAMSVTVDTSGRYIYTAAGRFRGRGAIGVFEVSPDNNEIQFLEGHLQGAPGLEKFEGGNQLALSPDGQRLYVVGSKSGTLSILDRDLNTGKLRPIETVAFRPEWKESVAGVVVSPNGQYAYVSGGEKDPSITVLKTLTKALVR